MKILLLDAIVDGHHADYASYLAKHLLKSGDEVTFATTAGMSTFERFQSIAPQLGIESISSESSKCKIGRIGDVAQSHEFLRRCYRFADSQGADIVHHLFLDGSELAWLSAPRRSRRTWATFASRFTLEYTAPSGKRHGIGASTIAFAKHRALRSIVGRQRLDGIFVHSARARAALIELLGPRVPAQAVTFVADPAPPLNTVPRLDARARLQLPADRPILLFFGGLRRDKGPDLFLRALAFVPGDWTAVIAGEPTSVPEQEVRELVAALPYPSNVILRLGVIADADVDDYFAAADAVVLPYRESYGRHGASSGVLLRATAAARPVVAADVGDVGPIVRTNQLGFVVPAESTVALAAGLSSCLVQRERVTREVAPRALAYARRNSWQVMGDAVRATYVERLSAAQEGR